MPRHISSPFIHLYISTLSSQSISGINNDYTMSNFSAPPHHPPSSPTPNDSSVSLEPDTAASHKPFWCSGCECLSFRSHGKHCLHCFHCIPCAKAVFHGRRVCMFSPDRDAYWGRARQLALQDKRKEEKRAGWVFVEKDGEVDMEGEEPIPDIETKYMTDEERRRYFEQFLPNDIAPGVFEPADESLFEGGFEPLIDPDFPPVPTDEEMRATAQRIIEVVYKGKVENIPGYNEKDEGNASKDEC
ncbi:hypothetical protein GQ43DRAFT_64226 [Delitschia confertaspora ATCC 74209]|uniref:Uncharacterized protein n=1 Tax=Delitschia confertaspora ATCC 74209 TaxID=1513339 RepID=A0A9P4JJP3_9PLEO|nr:hypothetical protein GQ43DRAFT_64226 [Delitschia confertaspora ATCC 74209]